MSSSEKSRTTKKARIFDNCIIKSPDDHVLSRCNAGKVEWYLRNDLAELIADNPPTIRLRFEPRGRTSQDHPLMLFERSNICVVCGGDTGLTKHHIVPSGFIRYFPLKYRWAATHDVVVMCIDCHRKYEMAASQKKQEIADYYGIEVAGNFPKHLIWQQKAAAAARRLVIGGKKVENPYFKAALQKYVAEYLGREPTTDDLLELKGHYRKLNKYHPQYTTLGEHVAKHITNYQAFFEDWRRHFVEQTNPQFMGEGWKIEGYEQLPINL